jgi:hypothetical protein
MAMTFEETLDFLARHARPAAVAGCAVAILVLAHVGRVAAGRRAEAARASLDALSEGADESAAALAEVVATRDQKLAQLAAFKSGLPKLAESRRQIYEGGLQLQEEKRLLEKQLEIMTTYLLIDELANKVHVMRGEQALETFPLDEGAPRAYGGARAAPGLSAIVSKERYAHPERPKSDQVGKQLNWEPPQVGESARANALGEFVVFTRGPLILHGPPKNAAEHAAFPHVCLELPLAVARRLYNETYIGTKIMLKGPSAAATPVVAKAAGKPKKSRRR